MNYCNFKFRMCQYANADHFCTMSCCVNSDIIKEDQIRQNTENHDCAFENSIWIFSNIHELTARITSLEKDVTALKRELSKKKETK